MNLQQLDEAKYEIEFWDAFWKMSAVLYESRVALAYQTKLTKLRMSLLPENIQYDMDDTRRKISAHISQTERNFHQLVVKNRDRPLKERASEIDDLAYRVMLLQYLEKAGF
jgi:hypothetical protein